MDTLTSSQTNPDGMTARARAMVCMAWGCGAALFLYLFPFEAFSRILMSAVAYDLRLSASVGAGLLLAGSCLMNKAGGGKWKSAGKAAFVGGILGLLLCGITHISLSSRGTPSHYGYRAMLETPNGTYLGSVFDEPFMRKLQDQPTAEVWLDRKLCQKYVTMTPENPEYYRFLVNGQGHPTKENCGRGLNVLRWEALPGKRAAADYKVTHLGDFS